MHNISFFTENDEDQQFMERIFENDRANEYLNILLGEPSIDKFIT